MEHRHPPVVSRVLVQQLLLFLGGFEKKRTTLETCTREFAEMQDYRAPKTSWAQSDDNVDYLYCTMYKREELANRVRRSSTTGARLTGKWAFCRDR